MIYLNHFFACSSSAKMTNSQSTITLARIVLKKCPEIKKQKALELSVKLQYHDQLITVFLYRFRVFVFLVAKIFIAFMLGLMWSEKKHP